MTPNVPAPLPEAPLLPDMVPALDPRDVPDINALVTKDDTPVDSIFAEKQQRLLTEPLYSSWAGPGEGHPFLALANVGYFHTVGQPPLVPDVLLGTDVTVGEDLRRKEHHSYFQWLMGKSPDVIIEIVSDRRGGEADFKQRTYARLGVLFYAIFDPENLQGGGVLRAFVLQRRHYEPIDPQSLPEVGLGLTLWPGVFEGHKQTWLRWCDAQGRLIPTGVERAKQITERTERLIAQLRALGVEPEV